MCLVRHHGELFKEKKEKLSSKNFYFSRAFRKERFRPSGSPVANFLKVFKNNKERKEVDFPPAGLATFGEKGFLVATKPSPSGGGLPQERRSEENESIKPPRRQLLEISRSVGGHNDLTTRGGKKDFQNLRQHHGP